MNGKTWRCPDCCGVGGCQTCNWTGALGSEAGNPDAAYGCRYCGNKIGVKHENACKLRGYVVQLADCFAPPQKLQSALQREREKEKNGSAER